MLNYRLEQFAQQNLVLGWDDNERVRIQTSIASLTNWLDKKPEVSETVVFGSWTRNTILPRRYDESSDIDIMVVFTGNTYSRDPESCRNLLRSYVAETYSSSYVRKDAPAVKLELSFIKYDLVPAVLGNWAGQFFIPNTGYLEGWMATTPKDLDPKLANANVRIGGNLVRNVIRLCKYLNKSNERTTMSSYELESFVLDNISNLPYSIPRRTYDFFVAIVRLMVLYGKVCSAQTMTNILDWIDFYKSQGNRDGQISWMNRLLPGFAT